MDFSFYFTILAMFMKINLWKWIARGDRKKYNEGNVKIQKGVNNNEY
jgi:hypothetical protein